MLVGGSNTGIEGLSQTTQSDDLAKLTARSDNAGEPYYSDGAAPAPSDSSYADLAKLVPNSESTGSAVSETSWASSLTALMGQYMNFFSQMMMSQMSQMTQLMGLMSSASTTNLQTMDYPEHDWSEAFKGIDGMAQTAVSNAMRAQKSESGTILTSPLLDEESAETTHSVLYGK